MKHTLSIVLLSLFSVSLGCHGTSQSVSQSSVKDALSVERHTITLPPDRAATAWKLTNSGATPFVVQSIVFNGDVPGQFGYFHAGIYQPAATPGTATIPPGGNVYLMRSDGAAGDDDSVWFIVFHTPEW